MTVEDHPKWKKWSDAYEALVKAAEDLRNNNRLPTSDPVYEAAVRRHKAHWITIIGFLQISIELVTLLITPVPTRSADGSAHDARVRLREATAGRALGSDPCGYRGSKDRPPAWHIFVKAMSAAA